MRRKVEEAIVITLLFVVSVYFAAALILGTINIYDALVGK